MDNTFRRLTGCAATAISLLAGPALAADPSESKETPTPERLCNLSANIALTSDYVFRGVSQTAEDPAVQGGFDATCSIFYAGVWASNLKWDPLFNTEWADLEIDWYGGVRPVTGKVNWDIGVLYYSYPGSVELQGDNNYLEIKVGASGEVWQGGTLGATVYYSPEYQYETGQVWTFEASLAQKLPEIWMFSPTVSALSATSRATTSATRRLSATSTTATSTGTRA